MDTIGKKDLRTRRRLFAVAIFLGLSATTAQATASQTENVYSNGSPVVELNFFDGGEFTSDYDFNGTTINAVKSGASYWKNIFDLRTLKTPWQIAVTSSERQILTGKTFSFRDAAFTQENFLAQMLQDGRELVPFDVQSFASEKISATELQKFLQEKAASEGYSALTVLTIGENVGSVTESNLRGWHFDDKTILPKNEQASDFFGAVRLELARALGVEALTDSGSELKFSDTLNDNRIWTLHLTDTNRNFAYAGKQIVTSSQFAALQEENPDLNAANFFIADDKVYFLGRNVTEVLDTATFDGVKGIPLRAWNGSTFDGVNTLIPGLMSGLPYKNYTTFTELELAALQDIGYSFDRKKYFGRSIYSSGGTFNLTDDFTSTAPLAIGLHVWGANNIVTQRGNISATGTGSVGIRVDGTDNQLVVPQGTQISGLDKGILVAYGRGHELDVGGEISSSGNAVEFNFGSNMLGAGGEYRGSYLRYLRWLSDGEIISARNLPLIMTNGFNYSADELDGALVDEFNLTGSLTGKRAIYIGKNAFVKNINFNEGAALDGDIISDWRHFTAEDGFPSGGTITPIRIQYGGKSFDAGKYIPDLTTHLNFNTSMNYGGNITGADNLKLHVNAGTFNFSGTADVVSVDVMRGAQLFGGNFTLHDMSADLAEGFTDNTTGTFINHGTIGAASPDTNLIITGNLISDGYLKKISGGTGGSIIVTGSANIEGSTVTTDSLLPNETATVLIADSITGEITNPEGKPFALSSMLNATGKVVDNTLTVTTHEANNLGSLSSREEQTLDAMKNMFDNLSDETRREEMRELYNLNPPEAKKTLSQIGSDDAAQVMSVAQQSAAVDRMISDRITRVFAPEYVDVNIRPMNFADDGEDTDDVEVIDVPVKVKVPENNFWLNYMKNWGSLRGGTDYHGSVIVGGYDRPFGKHWRGGIFATYGTIGYGGDSSRATVYDTRLGLYAGWHNRASDVYLYVNGGQLRNSLHRMLSSLGLSTNANYKSRIIEVGGEYKYDLQPRKVWHVSPFVNFQASHLRQDAYNEHGADIYNQHVAANSNTYFAAQAGLDFKRYYRTGMVGMRFGVKHGFTGADPELTISYEGDSANSYRLRHKRDKTHFVFSLRGENEFSSGWFLGGEAEFQLSKNDRDVTASLMLRRMW